MSNVVWSQATPAADPSVYPQAFVPVRVAGAALDGSQDTFAQISVPAIEGAAVAAAAPSVAAAQAAANTATAAAAAIPAQIAALPTHYVTNLPSYSSAVVDLDGRSIEAKNQAGVEVGGAYPKVDETARATAAEAEITNSLITTAVTNLPALATATVDPDMRVTASTTATVSSPSTVNIAARAKQSVPAITFADICGFASYGQSNAIGGATSDGAALTTAQPFGNLMFAGGSGGGMRTAQLTAAQMASFVPAVEARDPSSGYSETQVSTIINSLVSYMMGLLGITDQTQYAAIGTAMFGCAPGEGGRAIAQLSPGGDGGFEKMKAALGYATADALALNKTINMPFLGWDQGEQDEGLPTDQLTYYNATLALMANLKAAVRQAFGQTFDPIISASQLGTHIAEHFYRPQVAIAQLAAHVAGAFQLHSPGYIHEFDPSDHVHLSPSSVILKGRYQVRPFLAAVKQALGFAADPWDCVRPIAIQWSGTTILLTFATPPQLPAQAAAGKVNALRFRTDWVAATHNMGFDLFSGPTEAATLLDIITAVTVLPGNRVRISCSSVPPTGTVLRYAAGRPGDSSNASGRLTGPRGNLCDSYGDYETLAVYVTQAGSTVTVPEDNYCMMFESAPKS